MSDSCKCTGFSINGLTKIDKWQCGVNVWFWDDVEPLLQCLLCSPVQPAEVIQVEQHLAPRCLKTSSSNAKPRTTHAKCLWILEAFIFDFTCDFWVNKLSKPCMHLQQGMFASHKHEWKPRKVTAILCFQHLHWEIHWWWMVGVWESYSQL